MTKENTCKFEEETIEDTLDCPEGGEVGPVEDDSDDTNRSCTESPHGMICPTDDDPCYPWEFTNQKDESCVIEGYVEESITIGSAEVNVHKLLGIHEQGSLMDTTTSIGSSISSESHPNFPKENAFDIYQTEWRSIHVGSDVVKRSFIGYDFGPILLENGRERFGLETYVKRNISTIKIKQGCDSKNRVTRLRIERSSDGVKWYGVNTLTVPDCEGMVTLRLHGTVPSRYWRIRPLKFNGGSSDYWAVQALQLLEYEKTEIENIQDKIFLENRDRDYTEQPTHVKGHYTPIDYQAFLHKMGFNSPFNSEQFFFEFSFRHIVRLIGRPLVIGDILQIPSETYFTPRMEPTMKYLEITSVSWSTNSFTPHWVPTMLRVIAQPAMASQETQQIFGKLTEDVDEHGVSDINDGVRNKKYQDVMDVDQTLEAEANNRVPIKGKDHADVQQLSSELKDYIDGNFMGVDTDKLDRLRLHHASLDAIPPNGEDYTVGDDFPDDPADGDYHRLTYESIDRNIPPRLYRYSNKKKRWLYLETDLKFKAKNTKPVLTEFLNQKDETKADINKITDKINSLKDSD